MLAKIQEKVTGAGTSLRAAFISPEQYAAEQQAKADAEAAKKEAAKQHADMDVDAETEILTLVTPPSAVQPAAVSFEQQVMDV